MVDLSGLIASRTRALVGFFRIVGQIRALLGTDVQQSSTAVDYLQKREGLREVDRDGDLGEVLADAVLHDAPQREGDVRLVWDSVSGQGEN